MIVFYSDPNERNAYLKGDVVFYLDHDIPIKNPGQFMKELEKRVKPYDLTLTQTIKDGHIKHADKWIHDGWRLFCYDDYKTSFKYNFDFRFERLVDGHFRSWSISMNKKSIELSLAKSIDFKPECTWGEFIERVNKNDRKLKEQLGMLLSEVLIYVVPLFHSTKIIAATNKAEYKCLEDFLRAGIPLDTSINFFSKIFKLPLWFAEFTSEKYL